MASQAGVKGKAVQGKLNGKQDPSPPSAAVSSSKSSQFFWEKKLPHLHFFKVPTFLLRRDTILTRNYTTHRYGCRNKQTNIQSFFIRGGAMSATWIIRIVTVVAERWQSRYKPSSRDLTGRHTSSVVLLIWYARTHSVSVRESVQVSGLTLTCFPLRCTGRAWAPSSTPSTRVSLVRNLTGPHHSKTTEDLVTSLC